MPEAESERGSLARLFVSVPFRVATTALAVVALATLVLGARGLTHGIAAFLADILRVHFGTRGQIGRVETGLEHLLGAVAAGSLALALASRVVAAMLARAGPLASAVARPPLSWRPLDVVVVLLLALLGAVVRVPGLGQGLWLDELATFHVFVEPGLTASLLPRVALGAHPLLNWLVFPPYWLFGKNEIALRLPVFVASVASIPALYVASLALGLGRVAGLMSAGCLLVHSFHVFYSFQLRGYGLLGLFAIVSALGFTQLILSQGVRGRHLYVVGTVLLLYTHLYAVHILFAQMLIWAVMTASDASLRLGLPNLSAPAARRVLDAMLMVGLLSVLLYLPHVPVLLMIYLGVSTAPGFVAHTAHVAAALPALITASAPAGVGLLLLAAGLAGGFIAGDARVRLLTVQVTLSLLLFCSIPPGGTGFQDRYLFPLVPLVAWTIGLGCASLGRHPAGWRRLAGSGLLLAYAVTTIGGLPRSFQPIQPFRDAVVLMRDRASPGATFAGNSLGKDLIQFYEPRVVVLTGPEHLSELLLARDEIWVITSYEGFSSEFFAADVDTQREIETRFERVATFTGMIPVTLWRTPLRGSPGP